MRKLYLVIGLAVLLPVVDTAACGGGDNPGSGGNGAGHSAGPAGGQVQDYAYSIKVTWTILGKAVDQASCDMSTGDTVRVTLSGTEDPGLHSEKTLPCAAGTVSFANLTRLGTGAAPFIDAILINPDGITVFPEAVSVTPAPGTVTVNVDFSPDNPTTATIGPGPGPGAGGGGMGGGMGGSTQGAGGAGGASNGGAGPSSSAMSSSSTGP